MNKTIEKEIAEANPSETGYTIDDLEWHRLMSPQFVPKTLIEQIKHRDYSLEDFYKYHTHNCEVMMDGMKRLNPYSHLYALIDPKFLVKGVLWFCIDPLTKDIIIQTFSVDKEYWGKGKAVKKLANMIKSIKKDAKLNKIYWVTRYPKHSEHYGFKRSKSVLMEYSGEE